VAEVTFSSTDASAALQETIQNLQLLAVQLAA